LIRVDAGEVLGAMAVLGAGLLAGEEMAVRYGVRGPVAGLDDESHIRLRQGLVRTLRVLVPAVYLPTLVCAAAAALFTGPTAGQALRGAATLALLAWIGVTLGGTVPINAAVLDWSPSDPPRNWMARVDRWERMNTVRTWLAITAFALLIVPLAA
jgi:uncharacterized membrane protein